MALDVLGFAGAVAEPQKAIETSETSLNLSSFSCRYYAAVNDKLNGYNGEPRGKAVSTVPSRDIRFSGEVAGGTGPMAANWVTPITLSNDTTTFGSPVGGIYLEEVTESQTRDGWRTADFSCSSDPGIA